MMAAAIGRIIIKEGIEICGENKMLVTITIQRQTI